MDICKFCGKEKIGLTSECSYCQTCGQYCLHKCKIASSTQASWHREPCISCKYNPYQANYRWNGEQWEEK